MLKDLARPHPARALALVLVAAWIATACQQRRDDRRHDGPRQPGPMPAPTVTTPHAYVPSFEAGVISAIDLRSNELLWSVAVRSDRAEDPPRAAMGIAATRDGRLVFTGDPVRGEVVVVAANARQILERIPVPHGIHAIDISPDDRHVWVGGRLADHPWLSALSVIDTRTLEVVGTVSPALGNVAHLAFTPDGEEVWAASISTNLVWVHDTRTRELLGAIPLVAGDLLEARTPEGRMGLIGYNGIAIAPDGERAFAVGPEPGTLFAIDVESRQIEGAVRIGQRAHDVAVTRDGREAWVANDAGSVTIVDAETLETIDRLDMRRYADDETTRAHVAFSPDGDRAYLSWKEDVVVVDVPSRAVVEVIPVPEEPHEITLEDYFVR